MELENAPYQDPNGNKFPKNKHSANLNFIKKKTESDAAFEPYYFDEVSLCVFIEEFIEIIIEDCYKKMTRKK